MSKKRQANGEGSVYKRKDGRFGTAVSLGTDENGKRLRHVETGKTEQEAIDKMKLWLFKNGHTEGRAVVINGQSTVEEFVENSKLNDLKVSNISDVTFESYSYALKHFEQYFKGQKIGVIGVNDLKRFFVWMVNCQKTDGTYKYSKATLRLTKYIVGRMFSNAIEENYLQENPMDNAKLKSMLKNLNSKKKTPDIKSLTLEEIDALKNALMKNKMVYPVFVLMSVTGMRTQEALGLQWQDIDFENATINIRRAITEKNMGFRWKEDFI